MEYFVAVILIFLLLVLISIAKNFAKRARLAELSSNDQVVVSREFYESACAVSDLLNNSPSIKYKKEHLPKAQYSLEKEVLITRREELTSERSLESC